MTTVAGSLEANANVTAGLTRRADSAPQRRSWRSPPAVITRLPGQRGVADIVVDNPGIVTGTVELQLMRYGSMSDDP